MGEVSPPSFKGLIMFFKTREADGETIITGAGCILILFLLPLYPLIYVYEFFKKKPSYINRPSFHEKSIAKVLTHINTKELDFFYKEIHITKANGGERLISVPNDSLKKAQSNLLKALYKNYIGIVDSYSHAYIKGKSIWTNAAPHVNQEVVIKLDIKDFFGSITKEHLEKVFRFRIHDSGLRSKIYEICLQNGTLPQGAPTSPFLSNLVMSEADKEIKKLSRYYKANYTRYSDDITVSLAKDWKGNIRGLIKGIQHILKKYGFEIHTENNKYKILRKHQHQQVCGITVNSEKPTITRQKRRLLRSAQHRLDNGLNATLTQDQIDGWKSYFKSSEKKECKCPVCSKNKPDNFKLHCKRCSYRTNSSRRFVKHWNETHPRFILKTNELCKFHNHYMKDALPKLTKKLKK